MALQELQDMFPSWDRETLQDVLNSVGGSPERATDLLLQWSSDDQANSVAVSSNPVRERLEPVCPFESTDADKLELPKPSGEMLPIFLERAQYDLVMAKRLQRKAGGKTLAEVLKIASHWHHRAHLLKVASRFHGTAAAHLPTESPLAKDMELQRNLSNLSREEAIVEGKELLRERCAFLGLKQHEMEDDGNCQFRAISQELFGTQQYHTLVRSEIVAYMRKYPAEYQAFFEESEWQHYLETMAKPKTWGDEMSLRAAAETFGIKIHLVTSTDTNWLLEYSPASPVDGAREVFLTYVSPIHYNTIAPVR